MKIFEKKSKLAVALLTIITMMLVFLPMTAYAMQIFVEIDARHITLEVEPTDRIEDIRDIIWEKTGIPVGDQEIIFAGNILEDGNTLQDYSIQKDSTLLLAVCYDLRMNGIKVTSQNSGGAGWNYNPETKTLTLDGMTLSNEYGPAIHADSDLNIILKSSNTIVSKCDYGIVVEGDLNISGEGELKVTGEYDGIQVNHGNVMIDADVTVSGVWSYGIKAEQGTVFLAGGMMHIGGGPNGDGIVATAINLGKDVHATVKHNSSALSCMPTEEKSGGLFRYSASDNFVRELQDDGDYFEYMGADHISYSDGLEQNHTVSCTDGISFTEAHNPFYTANENVITETCICGHHATATLNAPDGEIVCDGTEKEGATVTYSNGWNGGDLTVYYENNVSAGVATASVKKDDATASAHFTIERQTYFVVFDLNGGSCLGIIGEIEIPLDVNGHLTDNVPWPTKEGYTFLGYYTDKDELIEELKAYTFTQNTRLYARYVIAEVSLPQTGDNSNMVLWFALMLVSLAGSTAIVRYQRREKAQRKE